MIEIQNLSKSFEDVLAVNNVSANISKGCVFGLLGTNGAGKSTLLRMMAGILKPDSGRIRLEGEEIFENAAAKSKISYIGDEQYFFPNSTPAQLEEFYAHIYSGFDRQEFRRLLELFQLNPKRKVNSFSKGMKIQLSLFLGLASGTPYLLCDETFDGLDPVARQAVKSLLASAMAERGLSSVIASHSLRELEDICDHIGLLHQGGLLLSRDLEDMKLSVHKVQAVFPEIISREDFAASVNAILKAKRIYILGVRSVAPLANFLGYYLNYMFNNVHVVSGFSAGEMFEKIVGVNADDVVIAFSFPRYSASTTKGAQYCRSAGATVIGFTDSKLSPLGQCCDHALIAKSDMVSLVDTLVAPLSIVNALIVAIAAKREKEISRTFANLERIWDEYNVYEKQTEE